MVPVSSDENHSTVKDMRLEHSIHKTGQGSRVSLSNRDRSLNGYGDVQYDQNDLLHLRS